MAAFIMRMLRPKEVLVVAMKFGIVATLQVPLVSAVGDILWTMRQGTDRVEGR